MDYIRSRYEVLHEVGQGGMGIVYRALHRALRMEVAVKVLRRGLSPDRFLREGRLLAMLRSPNVVSVHDFVALPSGAPMLVMDWIDGQDLRKIMEMQRGPISESRALPWMRDTCKGMQAAEEQRIVHRDLKPSNIMLDRNEQARITDFGLARTCAEGVATAITNEGGFLGSPLYMAPEQAEDPRSADTRADIYSFGATFYHVLTGVAPFQGDSPFSILFKHKTEPLISPRARCRTIVERTSELLERCLAKSPKDRFQRFQDVLNYIGDTVREGSPWDNQEDPEFRPYIEQYRARCSGYLRDWSAPAELDIFRFPEHRILRIVAGDITTQAVDAIVSSDDGELSMGGGVSRAILLAGGPGVHKEAARYAPVRPGRAVVTSAGNLPARFVFHGITMGDREGKYLEPSRDLIFEIINSCLYHAETLDLRTMAFPLLGTGAGRFPAELCLEAMFGCLARVLLHRLTPLREASIVIYQPHPGCSPPRCAPGPV